MVEEYRVSATSVVKMVMHAAKYAHGEVTGLLLGHAEPSGTQPVMIEDVIPLFHKTESKTSPLLEVALAQVESYASTKGVQIVGLYQANERNDDGDLHLNTKRIGDVIREKSTQQACIIIIDNEGFTNLLSGEISELPFKAYLRKGGEWTASKHLSTPAAAPALLQEKFLEGKQASLVDFSDHVVDLTLDWRNLNV